MESAVGGAGTAGGEVESAGDGAGAGVSDGEIGSATGEAETGVTGSGAEPTAGEAVIAGQVRSPLPAGAVSGAVPTRRNFSA
ncbi:hypothetical protein Ate01nite_44760 [Actinoplanes teichomyceticus]|nr:hypothetical protein Ate01nite_44760 [Actinoplanes teichomyceticus]